MVVLMAGGCVTHEPNQKESLAAEPQVVRDGVTRGTAIMITTASQTEGMAEERRILQERFPGWKSPDSIGMDYWLEFDQEGAFSIYRIQLVDRTVRYVYFDVWSYVQPDKPRPANLSKGAVPKQGKAS